MGEAMFPEFRRIHRFEISRNRQNYISALKFSPNGEFLAGVSDGFVRIWKVSTGLPPRLAFEKRSSHGELNDVVWSSDGNNLIGAAHDGNIILIDLTTKVETVVGSHEGVAFCCHVKPTTDVVATGGADGYVRQWDLRVGHSLSENLADTKLVTSVKYSSSGSSLVCGGYNGLLLYFKTARMEDTPRVDPFTTSAVSSLEFTPDPENYVVVGRVDGSIKLWDFDQPDIIKTFTSSRVISANNNYLFRTHFAATNYGQFIISGSAASKVYIWNKNRQNSPSDFRPDLPPGRNSADVIFATDCFQRQNEDTIRVASTSVGGQFIQVHESQQFH